MAKFFDEQAEQSQVKTAIVSKYFQEWARVITGSLKGKEDQRIAYIDLFAGPGRYKDGTNSTPVFILEMAIQNPVLRENLVTLFNDKDLENTTSLSKVISEMPGVATLKYTPDVRNREIGEDIVKIFEETSSTPTLFFVDPWGYKALSLELINSVLKGWACECIFFFNYNRINMGLSNPAVKPHMVALFGKERALRLAKRMEKMTPERREFAVVEEICEALVGMGGRYVLPFRFKNETGSRTSHHLIFVSKHSLGYKIMKRVMANESSSKEQGVASLEYNPATADQPLLFGFARPLDDLEQMLLDEFADKTMTMQEVYDQHNYGLPYTDKNYKVVLTKMELTGKIVADPPHTSRRKLKGVVTFADHVRVTFPPKQAGT